MPPKILAPAQDNSSFLAAMAAGADAIYCGFKNLNARIQAKNFSTSELFKLCYLAKKNGVKTYITLNSIVKENEIYQVEKALIKIDKIINADGVIISDLAALQVAEKISFSKEIHLSTLAAFSVCDAFKIAKSLNVTDIVLPRELTIDEIKYAASKLPSQLKLSVFVHGALCYGISGRCYWSSILGGKSSLRGRCVQPCRRFYEQKETKKFFSPNDLSIDILSKLLLDIPQISAWKIEGRKKGAHYVYYTTLAYKILRDNPNDPASKKLALSYLDYSLGRDKTKYNFLAHRRYNPINTEENSVSGFFVSKIKKDKDGLYINPACQLLKGDILRCGSDDDAFNKIVRITKSVPKRGKLYISKNEDKLRQKGVFLIDRREDFLASEIKSLEAQIEGISYQPSKINIKEDKNFPIKRKKQKEFLVNCEYDFKRQNAFYLSLKNLQKVRKNKNFWVFSPPFIFPEDEKEYEKLFELAIKKNIKNFILNNIWQIAFLEKYKNLNIWAGPFCNITNSAAINILKKLGFNGVIVSPELDKDSFIALGQTSRLDLGALIYGNYPLSISRVKSDKINLDYSFTSPHKEEGIIKQKDKSFFVYPNWQIDLKGQKQILQKNGYCLFLSLEETFPKHFQMKQRQGLWNWNMKLF